MPILQAVPTGQTGLNAKASTLFQAAPFFLIRAPLLPVETYQELFSSMTAGASCSADERREATIAHLIELSQDPVIREAIAVSSLSLLDSLPHLANRDNTRKRDQAVKGLLRYLIRMMTRSTPFGLFAGVACGEFAEEGAIRLQPTAFHRKRTRPDMQWLMKVIQRLEETESVVWQLEVQANPMIEQVGARTRLPFATRYGVSGKQAETLSVRTTPVVQLALQAAADWVPFAQLVERVAQEYPDVPLDTIKRFLGQLFQQELLISHLRPPLTVPSPLPYLLERLDSLQGIEVIKQQLHAIAAKITEYDQRPVGEGEALYRQIVKDMKQVADAKDVLQVDLLLATDQAALPESIADDVARAAEVLWRLSPADNGFPHLQSYRQDFLERYGTAREVPLLELLDEDRGLGAPPTYELPRGRRYAQTSATGVATQNESLLMRWVTEVQRRGENELVLTDDRVRQLEPVSVDPQTLPLSLELYFYVHAASREALQDGQYQLMVGANAGSSRAGKTFGRFGDLLGESFARHQANLQEAEQAQRPGVLFAEVVYQSTNGRHSNVCLAPHPRTHEILLGTNTSKMRENIIALEDLLVGLQGHAFYLRSKRLGCVVVPTAGHMLNWRATPNVYRFLSEIAYESERRWTEFSFGALGQAPALPRVSYGRTILVPATWKLQADIFAGKETADEWREALRTWRLQWNVPRFVNVKVLDQQLVYDLEHPLHVEELRRDVLKLQEGEFVRLTETGVDGIMPGLESERGHHVVECVFPILPKRLPTADKGPETQVVRQAPIPDIQRLHLPGGEWLYVKLYGNRAREEEMVGWQVQAFCRRVEQQGLANLSFFMRYADPDPHIRLRFQGDPRKLWSQLLPLVHEWARELQQEGLMTRLVLDTYDPEIERYGGPELIQAAERMFAQDSKVAAAWVGSWRAGEMKFDRDWLGVVSVIDLLEQFGLKEADQVDAFSRMISHKEHQEEFRSTRKAYLHAVDARNDWTGLRTHPDGPRIWESLKERAPAVRDFAEQMVHCDQEGRLYNNKRDILMSVIHLHLNRLFGVNRQQERKVMALTRHALVQLQQYHIQMEKGDVSNVASH